MDRSAKGIEMLSQELFDAYKLCFCKDSTEKWIKMFCEKRLERIDLEVQEEEEKALSKQFKNKVINRFTELMLEYVKECRKIARKKEREELDKAKKQVKRGKQ